MSGKNAEVSGEGLTLLAALAAIQLSQGRSADQVALLAAFFTVLGDSLALIATARPSENGG